MTRTWRNILGSTAPLSLAAISLGLMLFAGGCASDGTADRPSPSSSTPSRSGTTAPPSGPSQSPTGSGPALGGTIGEGSGGATTGGGTGR
jgi:hypothetical protein